MPDFDVNSVPTSEAEVDSLLSSIEAPVEPVVETAPNEEQAPPPEATPAEIKKWELVRKGIKKQFTGDELVPFAQKGWDYEEKMREYNQARTQWEAERKTWEQSNKNKLSELEQKIARYRDVDEYIGKDPQWWEHVQAEYQKRMTEQGPSASPYDNPVVKELVEKVQNLTEYVGTAQERERLLAESQKDEALDAQVAEYREKFPHFDWNNSDQQGLDLEKRIIKHAIDNNIGSFKAAANDYLFDEHVKRSELRAKEETGKEIKTAKKLGLGPVTDKKTHAVERSKNVRAKSYDDLVDEALAEING